MKRIVIGVLLVLVVQSFSSLATAGDVPQKIADTWPAKWCQAQPGATKESLVALMGPPTSGSAEFMSWSTHQYQFNAFLEPDGTVRQLDTNLSSLSDAEKEAIKCAEVRNRDSMAEPPRAPTPKRSGPRPLACALVTAKEMSSILGAAVVAEAEDRSSAQTKCTYKPAAGDVPYVEFSVEWDSGETAMAATGMMEKHEPGIASPYDGIGDQAVAVGPALMIRTGHDFVTLVFSGVADKRTTAKRILDTAKPRM